MQECFRIRNAQQEATAGGSGAAVRVPYRNSLLTRVLQNALSGDDSTTRTIILATVRSQCLFLSLAYQPVIERQCAWSVPMIIMSVPHLQSNDLIENSVTQHDLDEVSCRQSPQTCATPECPCCCR